MKKIFAAIVLAGTIPAFAQTAMPRLAIPTAENNGMGGTHIAYTDNVFSLLVNPAAMMRVEQKRFAPVSFTLYSPQSTFGLLGPMIGAISDLKALGGAAEVLSREKGKIVPGLGLNELPLSFAWVANGFGVGVWEAASFTPAIVGTNILLNANVDIIIPVGFAFRILHADSHDVDAGVTVKPFIRALISERARILDLMETANRDHFADDFSFPLLIGAGFDLGFMYRWDIGLSAALTLSDIATYGGAATDFLHRRDDTYYVPFSMNWGVAYDFRPGDFWPEAHQFFTESNVVFAVDWRDFTNVFMQDDYTRRNAALDVGLGLEFNIIKMFKLRLGMNECLPAFGLGLDFGPVEVDFAYFGRELGLEPGQLPVAGISLTFAVRPEAKPRNWPWTRRSLVGLIKGQDEPELTTVSQPEPEQDGFAETPSEEWGETETDY